MPPRISRQPLQGRTHRYLYRPHLDQLCITAIDSDRELALIDLRGAASYEAGLDTDASRARLHTSGQLLSEAIHAEMPDIDGLLFDSRLTAQSCIAIYDRAFATLSGATPVALLQSTLLPDELARLDIVVRRQRGYAAQ
jgi:hypothetical protein